MIPNLLNLWVRNYRMVHSSIAFLWCIGAQLGGFVNIQARSRQNENRPFFMPKAGKFFNQRKEIKFLLCEKEFNFLLPLLQGKIGSYFSVDGPHSSEIESVYFDGPECPLLEQNLKILTPRKKIRMRRYDQGNNLQHRGGGFLELKNNHNGVVLKERVFLSGKSYLDLLMPGKFLNIQEVINDNPQLSEKKLRGFYELFCEDFSQLNLRPFLRVSYKRWSFESDDIRVTLDKGLRVKSLSRELSDYSKGLDFGNFTKDLPDPNFAPHILEIKYQGIIPDWILDLISALGLKPKTFSKFLWASHVISKN